MNKLMIAGVVATMAAFALAKEIAQPAAPASETAKPKMTIEERTGGFIKKLPKKTNKIYFVNAQNRASDALIESARAKLDRAIRVDISMTNGTFELNGPKIVGELSLYIVDDAKLPMSLIAPEARWAVVNVAPLATGRGEKPAFFEARVRKEIARIGCLLFGGVGSDYKQNLLSFVSDPEGLDRSATDDLPVDGLQRCERYLRDVGVRQWRLVTYRDACQHGWAPAPTNDVQKAIWEQVRKIPDKPIKITYDKDKQKSVVK